jgi:hypothetical protein
VPSLVCWVVWAWVLVAGNGTPFPWPIFVTIGTGARAFRMVTDRQDQVTAIQRRLERRQARALERRAQPVDHDRRHGQLS